MKAAACREFGAPLVVEEVTLRDPQPDEVLVHQSQVVKVPPEMPLDLACLLACGVTKGFGAVVNRAQVRPLSSAVVIGVGGVRLNAIQGAALCGATPIIAVDVIESKLTRAMAFGATHAVNAACNDAAGAVKALTEGRGADYVFVTVGSNAAMGQAIAMLAKRGTAVAVGLPPIADPAAVLLVADLVVNEKSIVGAFMGSIRPRVDIPALAALYLAGRYKLDQLISGRYPLERINEALDRSAQGEVLRNVIVFPRHVG